MKKTYVLVAVAMALVAGCSAGAAQTPASPPVPTSSGGKAAESPSAVASPASPASDKWAKWGLTALPPAPAAPADKPVKLTATGPVPVFSEVPTKDKVVFVTIDDGAEKDPKFVEMITDLKIPISMFLTRDIVKDNYGYFKPLQALGNQVHNHTTDHAQLSKVSAEKQKSEVCDAQTALTQQYGKAPLLFRPPYGDGAHTPQLKHLGAAVRPRAIVLWRESMQIHDMQYQAADKKLKAGDIVLAHFRGPKDLKGETMTEMFAEMLRRIQEQGFAVARLEDYIQAG